jgi:hypothetical protein
MSAFDPLLSVASICFGEAHFPCVHWVEYIARPIDDDQSAGQHDRLRVLRPAETELAFIPWCAYRPIDGTGVRQPSSNMKFF